MKMKTMYMTVVRRKFKNGIVVVGSSADDGQEIQFRVVKTSSELYNRALSLNPGDEVAVSYESLMILRGKTVMRKSVNFSLVKKFDSNKRRTTCTRHSRMPDEQPIPAPPKAPKPPKKEEPIPVKETTPLMVRVELYGTAEQIEEYYMQEAGKIAVWKKANL